MKIGRTIFYSIIIIALLVWAGFTLVNNKKKSEEETKIVAQTNDRIAVNVSQAKKENISSEYTANGTFRPFQELMFPPETNGKVTEVLVDEGDEVKVGQTLAIIRGDIQSIDMSTAQEAYDNASTDYERYKNAFETGGVTEQQLQSSRLQLQNAKAQLDQAKIRVGDTHVRATISGIVNQRFIEPGSVVSPGADMFEIVNVSRLKLKVDVNESQIGHLKIGDSVKIKTSVYPGKDFVGKITVIAPKASSSLNFPVEIQVENQEDNPLKAGMYGTAVFYAQGDAKNTSSLVIPRDAFVGGLNSNEVYIVKDSVATLKKVVSGNSFGDKVEVVKGLQEGETVVTSGHINLSDSSKVRIIK